MRRAPWFKLDAHWWITSQEVAMLTSDGERALIRLLCWAWGDGVKPPMLPADDTTLAGMAKLTPLEWAAIRDSVLRLTERDAVTECLYFPVQMDQWKEMQGSYERRRAAGSTGGKAKAARRPGTAVAVKQDPVWESIRAEYPKRHGDQGWRAAESRYRAAVQAGTDPHTILAGVRRFATYIRATGKWGTEFVRSAEVFFGKKKSWEEPWTQPDGAAIVAPNGRPTAAARQYTKLSGGLRDS
jgi:hypothetical protein